MQTDDFLLRTIFVVCLFVFSVFRATRKFQVKNTTEEKNKSKERDGTNGAIRDYVLYPLWLTVMFLYPFNFSWMNYFALPYPNWVRWCGTGMAMISLPFFWWAHNALGEYFSTKLILLPDHMLIDSGPYRWMRHPMYSVEFLIFISACLISANLLVTIPNICALLSLCVRTKKEEEMLVERFGYEYICYIKRTGKFFPRFRKVT